MLYWHNTGTFFGHPPTGESGTMTETHSIKIHDGKIVEQIVGDNTFQLPYMDLVTWSMEWPKVTPDPQPEIMSASASSQA